MSKEEEYKSKKYADLLQLGKLRGALKGFKGKDFGRDNIIKSLLEQDSLFKAKEKFADTTKKVSTKVKQFTKLDDKVSCKLSDEVIIQIRKKLEEVDNLLEKLTTK